MKPKHSGSNGTRKVDAELHLLLGAPKDDSKAMPLDQILPQKFTRITSRSSQGTSHQWGDWGESSRRRLQVTPEQGGAGKVYRRVIQQDSLTAATEEDRRGRERRGRAGRGKRKRRWRRRRKRKWKRKWKQKAEEDYHLSVLTTRAAQQEQERGVRQCNKNKPRISATQSRMLLRED